MITASASYVRIQSLTVQNGEIGILFDSSNNSTTFDLDVLGNVEGMRLVNGSNNTIRNSFFADNLYGMKLVNSTGNMIFHNGFVRNTHQVQIGLPGQLNIWDAGYPSGGNYWSDYNGTDADHDGIGDTPYTIDLSNEDKYPSMRMPGTDVNRDGRVNVLDLILIANNLGWSGTPGSIPEDANLDGKVNVLDLIAVARAMNKLGT